MGKRRTSSSTGTDTSAKQRRLASCGGNLIKDAQGNTVYLTGINWFGFETDGANGFTALTNAT